MSETLIPVPQYEGTITIPTPGEPGAMQTGPAPLKPVLQRIADRADMGVLMGVGRMEWNGDFAVNRGGTLNNFSISIGAVQAAPLANDAGNRYDPYSYAGGNITQAKIEGGGGTLGAVKRWWYVYALPGGVPNTLDFEVSQNTPRSHRVYKSPVNTTTYARRYVGCFPTDAAGTPLAVTASRGCYRYRDRAVALHVGQSTADINTFTAALSLADLVPPHARIAIVRLQVTRDANGAAQVSIRVNGDTYPAGTYYAAGMVAGLLPSIAEFHIEMDVGAAREVQVATDGPNTFVTVDVAGWRE